ncbi:MULTISPECIES: acyl carrier protein phosphodiesterase [Mesoflavibacter]|uniref:Acyl carrier protein phosphodiesterase n=1 Tax=Mesoflavibacter profundi TaxID=2708110 RepID=A0ABT4RX07_9FLAO|nr:MULTISPECIES: acyl carrier protein phosphodiesterase [Mesoflavibacter]MDA0176285.1 acyl carrier protein phosphodiesterase [Mesoflavibacter profundi]
MNYLAHIYLSGNNKMLTIGNFIADGIRGKKYKTYPIEVQKGILLHRQIDTFTDAHPTVRQSTKRLHENYGHYSGIIVDILYDHFLAKNWSKYSDVPLEDYAENFYQILTDNIEILPQRILKMMPHLISGNWLLSYATKEGIAKVLDGMNKRTKNRSQMNLATKELDLFYDEFEAEFTSFFEELIAFSEEKLIQINQELS